MRVLITTDTVGGVWTFTRELIAGLIAEGCDVCCVSFGREPSGGQCAEAEALQAEAGGRLQFHFSAIALEWMEENREAYAAGAALLLRLISTWSPQVLHLNQFCYGALPCDLPKVVGIHSDVLSWAHACGQRGALAGPWLDRYKELVRRGVAGATLLTAPTRWMLEQFLRHFPADVPAQSIPNGISACGPETGSRRLQIATAGRFWDKGKGLHVLEHLHVEWPIVVAGDCAEEQTELQHVTFMGVLSAPALQRLFGESAVYLCASIYEPFGLAPLEAALCGCAVVARKLPSLEEVWGDAALYFSDVDELQKMLHVLREDSALLAQAQQRAGARARVYTRERMTREYLAAYGQAMEMYRAA